MRNLYMQLDFLIEPTLVIEIIAVLFFIAFLVVPFVLLNPNSADKKNLQNVDSFNASNFKDSFKSIDIKENKIVFKRADGVDSVKIQLVVGFEKGYKTKFVILDFYNDDPIEMEFKNPIKTLDLVVIKKDGEKRRIVGPKFLNYLLVAVLEGLVSAAGAFLYIYSNSGLLPGNFASTYWSVYLVCLGGLVVAALSFVLNYLVINVCFKRRAK